VGVYMRRGNGQSRDDISPRAATVTRLKLLGKFSSGDISVDIEDLAVRHLSQAGKNGQCACSDGCLNGTPTDTSDVSDKVVLVFVEIVGGEYARGDRAPECLASRVPRQVSNSLLGKLDEKSEGFSHLQKD